MPRNPDAPAAAAKAGEAPARGMTEARVLAAVGGELAARLDPMRRLVEDFQQSRQISTRRLDRLRRLLAEAEDIGRAAQQIARLAEGRLRQSHERLSLDGVVREAIAARKRALHEHGCELTQQLRAIDVIVDPGLLCSLVDAALEWAMQAGHRIQITLEMKTWPEHALLRFRCSDPVAAATDRASERRHEGLSWHLLQNLADAIGASVQQEAVQSEVWLTLEFARTVRQLEGLTAVEVDAGDNGLLSESKPLAGCRLLLVSDDARLRSQIEAIARSMGLTLDSVPTSRQAVRYCELDAPHLMLIEEALHDERLRELRDDLRRAEPNFPVIEIARAPNVLEVANPWGDGLTRVSRDTLQSQLPSMLVMELAKVV